MSNTLKKVISLILVVVTIASFAGCSSCNPAVEGVGDYTYKSYSTSLGNNWNPHTWETSADDSILSYLSSPFITMEAKDTEKGLYQWVYEMATSIEDVTKDHKDDLTKYKVSLPKDKTAADIESGYVFEIKLNPDAKWENGKKITANDYIYSMKQLLDSKMRNYRANLYVAGESALAGAQAYYDSEAPIYKQWDWDWNEEDALIGTISQTTVNADGYVCVTINGEEKIVYLSTSMSNGLFGASWKTIHTEYGYGKAKYFDKAYTGETGEGADIPAYVVEREDKDGNVYYAEDLYAKYSSKEDSYGVIPVTPEILEDIKVLAANFAEFGSAGDDGWNCFVFYHDGFGEKVEYDTVGCYKVDDYTIRYVCQNAIDYYYFLTSCTSTWLVYEELYEAGKDTSGDLITTNYGTSAATTMSYGVYKLNSIEPDKQIVFVQNENWYGWERNESGELVKDEEGNLVSYTTYHKNLDGEEFKVDGQKLRQHTIEKVVIDVMEEAAAKAAFLKGELSDWSTPAAELPAYAASDRLYKVDETYTMSFFFNTDLAVLQNLDAKEGNKNSVVLSNTNFRKAFSLAIDRAKYVTATEGFKPAFALLNNLYYYDFYNDPDSRYRDTDQAKEAICNLYGVTWGEGTPYATLDDAVNSITGYNLEEAKQLFKAAFDELVAENLYTAGQPIDIKIGWAKGALTDADNKQATLMTEFINAAAKEAGFGTITFIPVGNIEDRYGDTAAGKYAIGYGAWGGAALYPFRNLQTYCDPSQYALHEGGCWDPSTEQLTLKVNGEDVTMTWQAWSNCMIGNGQYASADFETKLDILSALETAFLKKYYRIPLAATTICSMLSYQLDYYTQEYNFAYGFGGSRLMKFNYDDAEWAQYVSSQGGKLSYE